MERVQQLVKVALAEHRRVFDPSEVYVTFAALCQADNRKSDTERRTAIACCRGRLHNELARTQPGAGWLVLGKWVVLALTGSEKKVEGKYGFHAESDLAELADLARLGVEKLTKKTRKKVAK
jgi:uracil-DNA glycosylase